MPPSDGGAGRARRLVVISDFCDGSAPLHADHSVEEYTQAWRSGARGPGPAAPFAKSPPVVGGYLERLPLASINQGLCDVAEIWSFWAHDEAPPVPQGDAPLIRRSFRADPGIRPFVSNDLLGHIAACGSPEILCVWGLGVDEAIMQACSQSVKIYNSIDAPALRIPDTVSRHFDLVLTGAEWQSQAVEARHPGMATAIMPIGPEFASPDTFFPLGQEKVYDVIYVAAAQAYKRHDILFDAMARLPRSIRGLCVCGYGELGEELRARAHELGIEVDFIGPPGVPFAEVNRLMNLARIGVVCGVDDGAPAILTEYQLAGLPVLANAELSCGLQFITLETGRTARADEFHIVLMQMLDTLDSFHPRQTAIPSWGWQATAPRFGALVEAARRRKDAVAMAQGRDQVDQERVTARPFMTRST